MPDRCKNIAMKKVRFIYNPRSGETIVAYMLDEIIAMYQKRGLTIVPYRLSFERDPSCDIIDGLDTEYHHILIAGGDGTVNFVVNILMSNGIDLPVAVLPTGTANDFASMLGMPSDIRKACRKILAGEVRRVDVGDVNGRYFVNIFSCGLFTDVSQKTPTLLKNTFGKLAYYVRGLSEIPKFRPMRLTITSDGGNFEGSSLIFFVFNGQTAGKMRISYLSQIDDGLLDVIVVKGDDPAVALQAMLHYFSFSRNKGAYPSGIVHFQCKQLTAISDTAETTDIDGQAGPQFPLAITCHQGALQVIFSK